LKEKKKTEAALTFAKAARFMPALLLSQLIIPLKKFKKSCLA